MVITLVGYRGTGKSSLAPRLATKLNFDWVDADVELERSTGRSIREIFASDGEAEFRRLERELIVQLLQRDHLVLAAGGGAILNDATRKEMRQAGPVVWLQASAEAIGRRILRDDTNMVSNHRPRLTGLSGIDEIRSLLAVREPLYRECATIQVVAEYSSLEGLAQKVLAQLPETVRQEPQ